MWRRSNDTSRNSKRTIPISRTHRTTTTIPHARAARAIPDSPVPMACVYSGLLPASDRQYPITGLHLIALLGTSHPLSGRLRAMLTASHAGCVAHNRIADFHTELELIPLKMQSNANITYPVRLEPTTAPRCYGHVCRCGVSPHASSWLSSG